ANVSGLIWTARYDNISAIAKRIFAPRNMI
ncbi:MAG: hypothetical protein H6R35_421, partial [Bacteroidetes bacterium]|nr:hypothetical protein [Bacteroidota bacterium]